MDATRADANSTETLGSNGKLNLRNEKIDDIVRWRNSASARVAIRDKEMLNINIELAKLSNKNEKDKKWIAKLNSYLNEAVFKYPTKPRKPVIKFSLTSQRIH